MVTLILLPGLDGTGTLFDAFVAALGTEFNVKVVSYPTTEPLDYSELEAIARSALPAEGPFVILGESFSGHIAVSLAASSSSQLKGLVLCCTFVRNPRPVFAIFKPLLGLLPIAFAPVSILIRPFLGRASTAALLSALTQALAQVSPSLLRARIRGILSVDVSSKLAELNVPVLYLRAAQDHLVPQTASQLVTQLCPRAQVVQLETPHFLLQAAPSEAAKIIAAFIRGVE
jgi:pimeloyl-ACP methyl ester carboxylesterase